MKIINHTLCIISFLLLFSCAPTISDNYDENAESSTSDSNSSWEKTDKTEDDFFQYFSKNKLGPLEGMWTLKSEIGTNYKIAIIKDENLVDTYNGYTIDSGGDGVTTWKKGYLKCTFETYYDENQLEVKWYMSDFTSRNILGTFNDEGTILLKFAPSIGTLPLLKTFPKKHKDNKIKEGTGSGFLISESGYVVTNYHVVMDSDSLIVNFPHSQLSKHASIVMKDKKNDIAILQVNDFDYMEISMLPIPFTLGYVSNVNPGQEVFTVGFPLGDIMGSTPRYSEGTISALYGLDDDPAQFQISNPLQPGNSGGGLFNKKGELVGIVVSGLNAKLFSDYLGVVPQNVNFAIKVNYLEAIIDMLPDIDKFKNRTNTISSMTTEQQVQALNPIIVQIKTY